MRDAGEYYDVFDANRTHIAQYDRDFAHIFPTITAVTKELAPFNAVQRRHFAIMQDGVFAGSIGMHLRQPGVAELFYWIDQQHIGQNSAARAGDIVVDDAFSYGYIDEMRAVIAETNQASQRVAQKMGFTLLRKVYDEMHFSLQSTNSTSIE